MANFLQRLIDNPRGAFGSTGTVASTDEWGNPYDAYGSPVKPPEEPTPSLSESLLNIAESPAKMAVGAVTAPLQAAKELFTGSGDQGPTLYQGPDAPGNARRFADVASPFFGGEAFSGGRALADAAALGTKSAAQRALLPDSMMKLASDSGKANPVGAAVSGSLPMDEASRLARAREMGFDTDTPWYHSSLKPLDEFTPHGKFMGKWGVSGTSLTDNPEMASRYLDRYGDIGWVDGKPNQEFQKNIMPLYVRGDMKIKDLDAPIAQNLGLGYPLPKNYTWPPELDGYDAVRVRDAINVPGKPAGSEAELLSELGFDDLAEKVQHTSLNDPGGIQGRELIVRNPSHIRSKFAAFNPADADKAGLLLSDTGKPSLWGSAITGANNKALSDAAQFGSGKKKDKK